MVILNLRLFELGDALLVVLCEVAAVEDCKELVAAHAVDFAKLGKAVTEDFGGSFEVTVALGVTVFVIDFLQEVDVKMDEKHLSACAFAQFLFGCDKGGTAAKTCEGILHCKSLHKLCLA